MQNNRKRETRRMAEFGLIGGVVALLSFVQLWFMIDVLKLNYWLAYIIQTIVSVELNYFGNYWTTWRDRQHEIGLMKSHLTFWATRSVMILINPVFFVALAALGVNYLWAQVVVVSTNTIINYYLGDKLVFKVRNSEV